MVARLVNGNKGDLMIGRALVALMTLVVVFANDGARAQDATAFYDFNLVQSVLQRAQMSYLRAKSAGIAQNYGSWGNDLSKKLLQRSVWVLITSADERDLEMRAPNARGPAYVNIDDAAGTGAGRAPVLAIEKEFFPGAYANLNDAGALKIASQHMEGLNTQANAFRDYNPEWKNLSPYAIISRINEAAKNDPFDLPEDMRQGGKTPSANAMDVYREKVDRVITMIARMAKATSGQFSVNGFKVRPEQRWALYQEAVKQAKADIVNPGSSAAVDQDLKGDVAGTLDPRIYVSKYMYVSPAVIDMADRPAKPAEDPKKGGRHDGAVK